MTVGNFCIDGNFSVESLDGLSEKDLRELNRVAQAKLDEIEGEKRRKAELKKNYALKDIPSKFEFRPSWLGNLVKGWFEQNPNCSMPVEIYNKLMKDSTEEIKPKRSEIYSCPYCGKFNLRVGNFGMNEYSVRNAVCCESCDFEVKKKVSGKEYYAWEIFHEWLIKHGYLDKSVKFQY